MEKLPILYNGGVRCHGNVGYIFLIDVMFCKVHRIGPRNMCVDFERNRLRIEDFRKSEKIVCFLWRDVARKRDVVPQIWGSLSEEPFCKECFPTHQKFLRLPVQKLWPIMWLLQKWWHWPWPLSDFKKNKRGSFFNYNTSYVKKSGRSVQWCGLYIANRRTNKHTWPWPFTFHLDVFPWHLTLIFDLETDLLLPWCFEENITKMYCFDVTWRKNGTSYVITETTLTISILSVNILQPTRSLYGFRFQSYGSKGDFNGFWCVWPWPWHFKVIWFCEFAICSLAWLV